jgi:hypothetical protein
MLKEVSATPIREGRRVLYSLSLDDEAEDEACSIDLPGGRLILERTFEDRVCEEYDRMGILHERQKRVETGIIDIFVYGQPPKIIEAKRSGTPANLIEAIVQLKFYGSCFKKSLLYISVPGGVEEKYRNILRTFNVGEVRLEMSTEGETRLFEFDTPEATDGSRP